MAKFPLVINTTSKKIEEIPSGEPLNLSGNGISINGDRGIAGQLLKSTGTELSWGYPSSLYHNDSIRLTVDANRVTVYQQLNLNQKSKPSSNSDPSGTPGDVKWYADPDGSDAYIYVCVAPGVWKRAALNNFFP